MKKYRALMRRAMSKGILIVLASLLLRENADASAANRTETRSPEELKVLAECVQALTPASNLSLERLASDELMQVCLIWEGFSLRAASNADLEADYKNAIIELYRSQPSGYAECVARATGGLALWQKQKIYEAESAGRENDLIQELDRERIVFRNEGPATAFNGCFTWPQTKLD